MENESRRDRYGHIQAENIVDLIEEALLLREGEERREFLLEIRMSVFRSIADLIDDEGHSRLPNDPLLAALFDAERRLDALQSEMPMMRIGAEIAEAYDNQFFDELFERLVDLDKLSVGQLRAIRPESIYPPIKIPLSEELDDPGAIRHAFGLISEELDGALEVGGDTAMTLLRGSVRERVIQVLSSFIDGKMPERGAPKSQVRKELETPSLRRPYPDDLLRSAFEIMDCFESALVDFGIWPTFRGKLWNFEREFLRGRN